MTEIIYSSFEKRLTLRRPTYILQVAEIISDYIDSINALKPAFPRHQFYQMRRLIGTQAVWGDAIGVTGATVGNYERGFTVPEKSKRDQITVIAKKLLDLCRAALKKASSQKAIFVDPIEVKSALSKSILKASLTDFEYSKAKNKIVPVTFKNDARQVSSVSKEDRASFVESLAKQCEAISEELSFNSNAYTDGLRRSFIRYRKEALSDGPNARLLHRWGLNIRSAINDENVRASLRPKDEIDIEGFLKEHVELMRLYFTNALSQVQALELAEVAENEEMPTSQQFLEIAQILEGTRGISADSCIDGDIVTLVRDFSSELKELEDGERFFADAVRRALIRKRRIDSIKTGIVYVSRLIFVSSIIVVATPAVSPETIALIAALTQIIEAFSPGTLRGYLDKFREFLPSIPPLLVETKK